MRMGERRKGDNNPNSHLIDLNAETITSLCQTHEAVCRIGHGMYGGLDINCWISGTHCEFERPRLALLIDDAVYADIPTVSKASLGLSNSQCVPDIQQLISRPPYIP